MRHRRRSMGQGSGLEPRAKVLTPWTASVASGHNLLREPHYNKGLAFTEKERDAHYLRGLLPPTVLTQELQEKKMMHDLRKYEVPLKRFAGLKDTLFFTVVRIKRVATVG